MSPVAIRPMSAADLPSILAIQALCYTELILESEQSLRAKLHASPLTCHVVCHLSSGVSNREEQVIGYLIAVPCCLGEPPPLNAQACILPAHADSLYLHDMAVMPTARKTGAGKALVEKFLAQIEELNFRSATLVAVQGSRRYWQRYGFQTATTSAALQTKLLSYGDNVEYMQRSGCCSV